MQLQCLNSTSINFCVVAYYSFSRLVYKEKGAEFSSQGEKILMVLLSSSNQVVEVMEPEDVVQQVPLVRRVEALQALH